MKKIVTSNKATNNKAPSKQPMPNANKPKIEAKEKKQRKSFWNKFNFKNIAVVKLVYIGFSILTIMLIVASVSTFYALGRLDGAFKDITNKTTPLVITAKTLDKSLVEAHKALVELLNSKNPNEILQLTNTYNEEKGKLEATILKFNDQTKDNYQLKEKLQDFNSIFQNYLKYTSNIPNEYHSWISENAVSLKNISSYRALVNLYSEEYNALKLKVRDIDDYVHQLMLAPEMLKGSIVTNTDQALTSEDVVAIEKALKLNKNLVNQYLPLIEDIKKNLPDFENSLGKYYRDFVRDVSNDDGVLAVHLELAKNQEHLKKQTANATAELNKLSNIINEITALSESEMKNSVDQANNIIDFSYLEFTIMLMIGIIVALVVAYVIGRVIRIPLTRIVKAIKAMSQGDMTTKVDYEATSEFGYLAKNMNSLIEVFRNTLSELSKSVVTLQESAHSNSKSMSVTVDKIKMQQNETLQIVNSMDLVQSAADDVAKSTDISLSAILDVNEAAETGRKIMSDNITTNHALADQLDRTSNAISEVNQTSNNIGQIVEVIKSIAEQTNLLALNAAIESARAGEHGRGFAVVADEVRSLSQKTSEATNQVNKLIESLQSVVVKAVTSIKDCQEEMERSVMQTSDVNSSIEEIKASLTTISDMAHHIAESADQQRATATEVGQNVSRISEISEANTNEINKANDSCLTLDDLATAQKKMVAQFKF